MTAGDYDELVASDRSVSGRWLSPATKTFVVTAVAHGTIDMCGGVWPIFKNLAGLDLYWAGLVSTVAAMATAALQPVFGFYADRGHRRLLLLAGMGLISLMALLGPIAMWRDAVGLRGMYLLFFMVLLLSRLGLAMFHPAGMSLAGNISSKRRSTLLAGFIMAGTVGVSLSWLSFSKVYKATGGHTEWLLLPPALLLWLIWLWCRPVEPHEQRRVSVRQILGEWVHLRRHMVLLYLMQALMSGVLMGLIFLLPEFVSARHYPVWLAHWGAMMLMFVGGGLMMVPAGHLADRLGRRVVLIGVLGSSVAAYYAFVRLPTMPTPAFALLCLATGACMQAANPMTVAIAQHLAPRNESMISGVMLGLAWALGAVAPAVVGYMAKQPAIGVIGALTWLGLANVVALLLALCLPKLSATRAA